MTLTQDELAAMPKSFNAAEAIAVVGVEPTRMLCILRTDGTFHYIEDRYERVALEPGEEALLIPRSNNIGVHYDGDEVLR